jgi:hypothetical protein
MKWLARFAHSLFSRAQCTKVLRSLGDGVTKKTQDDSTSFTIRNFDIKKDFVSDRFSCTTGQRRGRESRRVEGVNHLMIHSVKHAFVRSLLPHPLLTTYTEAWVVERNETRSKRAEKTFNMISFIYI